jgi:hypothetical protein
MADKLGPNIIKGWKGDTVEDQNDLFNHMFMYILQRAHNTPQSGVLSESEWIKLSRPVVFDHADFYATDMFDDVLSAYDVEDLLNFRGYCSHNEDDGILRKIYPLYVDFSHGVVDKYNDLYKYMDEVMCGDDDMTDRQTVRVTDV